jgi:crotonobetainyl-CoA:carnitine CoA-transferase CaiB-like acyl-CoA transferase
LDDDADWLAVACQDQCAWQGLATLLGNELDPGWDFAERVAHAAAIDAVLADWSLGLDKDAAAEALQQVGVAAGPVATAPDMLAESQAQAREFFVPYERFATPIPGNPIHMSGLSHTDWAHCPALGAHSQSVLQQWLNMSPQQTQQLLEANIIAERPPD